MTTNPAVDELRELLSERNVKWRVKEVRSESTWVHEGWLHNVKFEPWGEGTLKAVVYDVTPQEAVGLMFGDKPCGTVETEVIDGAKAHVMECDACGGTYEHVNGDYEYCPHCRRRIANG